MVRNLVYSFAFMVGLLAIWFVGLAAVARVPDLVGLSHSTQYDLAFYVMAALTTSILTWSALAGAQRWLITVNYVVVSKILSALFGALSVLAAGLSVLTAVLMVRADYSDSEIGIAVAPSLFMVVIFAGPAIVLFLIRHHLKKNANQQL